MIDLSNPKTRYALRGAFAGLLAASGALKAYLPGLDGADIADIVGTGIIASGAYLGVGYATPLEPSVGKQTTDPPAGTTLTSSTVGESFGTTMAPSSGAYARDTTSASKATVTDTARKRPAAPERRKGRRPGS